MKIPGEFILIPGCEIADDMSRVPNRPGVYLIFLDGGHRVLTRTGYFEHEPRSPLALDDRLHLYTGAAAHLYWHLRPHFHGDRHSSSFRKSLLSMERVKRAISGNPTEKSGIEDEASLSEWLFRNALVAVARTSAPSEVQRRLLKQYPSPFNISHRRHHPYSRLLMEWRRAAFPP